MTQTTKDRKALAPICQRFVRLMKEELKMSRAELARQLGYANASTLSRVQKGETFPDIGRLQKLSQLRTSAGTRPNLDWLITGKGEPVLSGADDQEARGAASNRSSIDAILQGLEPDQIEALACLLRRP